MRVRPRFALALGPRNGRARRKNDLGWERELREEWCLLLR